MTDELHALILTPLSRVLTARSGAARWLRPPDVLAEGLADSTALVVRVDHEARDAVPGDRRCGPLEAGVRRQLVVLRR